MALLPFRKTGGPPLRVGIVFDGPRPLRWVEALIIFLNDLPALQTHVFALDNTAASAVGSTPWLTSRLYGASRRKLDPFSPVDLAPANQITVLPGESEAIRVAKCGVLIWLASWEHPGANARELASHGIFTVALGRRPQAIPFWDEVSTGEPTSAVTIFWHDSSPSRGRPVVQAETSTLQGLYLTASAGEPLAAAIRLFAGLCLELQCDAPACEEKLRRIPEQNLSVPTPSGYPSSLEAGIFLTKKLSRSAWLRWKTRGLQPRWFVAMRPNSGASITDSKTLSLAGFQEVPLPEGSQAMADPFLHEADGRTYLFFEDEPAGKTRARLGCAEVLENGRLSEMTVVLERDYHLSYPCIVPSGNDLFLLPESGDAGRVDLFRFTRFPSQVELVATFVEGLGAVDTTPVFLEGLWYFFTTTVQPFMETLLFWSDSLCGPWKLHPSSPISCSVRNSRSAGNLFRENGRLFRPTQDCSVSYGYAITVNEITRLSPTEFAEHRVSWAGPSWARGLLGTHTWNASSRFQVIDGIRFNRNSAPAPEYRQS